MPSRQSAVSGLAASRGSLFTTLRLLCHSVFAAAAPMVNKTLQTRGEEEELPEGDMFAYYVASAVLVLAGGAFAGLTIALMGQDGVYLQVLAGDASEPQSKNAQRVYDLLKRGKHWVLVTLLLSNVIVNETLPVVLDRCLGGGVAAVIGSTVLIVIFGEVIPQSVCVRFGLQIGGAMAKPVLAMMWMMAPVAWPIAKLLDWMLGEDHPTVYKKSGLKQLVNLHQTLGDVSNRLNADEVTIISAVLDLKDKPVRDVMTPMDDVFVMPDDTVLDERTMDRILSAGYSRIPIHAAGNPKNFVGMLLVKILITYDPEDCKLVRDFALATLPETRPETSCLDIVNFFQEGKSHMVIVSACPGEDHGAMGVVTLEDVIEELIGEEIIDESDVYIDVHKAIRRLTPAPKARISRHETDHDARLSANHTEQTIIGGELSASPRPMTATFMMRAPSSDGRPNQPPVAVKANLDDMRSALKRLGPSNPATNPRESKLSSVKIKHGLVSPSIRPTNTTHVHPEGDVDDERTPLLSNNDSSPPSKHLSGKGGVQAVRKSYGSHEGHHSESQHRLAQIDGTLDVPESAPTLLSLSPVAEANVISVAPTPAVVEVSQEEPGPVVLTTTDPSSSSVVALTPASSQQPEAEAEETVEVTAAAPIEPSLSPVPEASPTPTPAPVDIIQTSNSPAPDVTIYRATTGSVITESIIETHGVRKIVIHTSSSGDEAGPSNPPNTEPVIPESTQVESVGSPAPTSPAVGGKKKKNKKKKKGGK